MRLTSAAEPYRDSVYIAADPSFVFRYFTEPQSLVRWLGDDAVLDPRPGGQFTVLFGERTVEGRYIELDPPHRLVISWGRAGSKTFPPSTSTLEVTLTPEAGGSRVSIVHTGLPQSERARHALGWQHYLARLAIIGGGRQPDRHSVPAALTEGVD